MQRHESILKPAWMFLWIALVGLLPECAPANGTRSMYYSVYTHAYTDRNDAGRRVRYLRGMGNPAFLRSAPIPGEMAQYKVYVGRYADTSEALACWQRLHRQNLVSHFSIHMLRDAPSESRPGQLAVRFHSQKSAPQAAVSGQEPIVARFVDNGDGTVTDRATRLMWVKNGWRSEFRSALTWREAIDRAGRLKLAGYQDWRLPTLEEWNSLLDPDRQFPALVEPNPFTNMISHMPYWSRTEYAYGGDFTCNTVCPVEAYSVMLYSGSIIHQSKQDRAFVMMVRSIDGTQVKTEDGRVSLTVPEPGPGNPKKARNL